jgi:hypothetical protein
LVINFNNNHPIFHFLAINFKKLFIFSVPICLLKRRASLTKTQSSFHRMLQTCCAISRKNSQLDRRQILPDGEEQFGRPIEDRRIGLLDISNSNLEWVHLIELIN